MWYHIEVSATDKSEAGERWRESGASALWGLTNGCCGQASQQSPEWSQTQARWGVVLAEETEKSQCRGPEVGVSLRIRRSSRRPVWLVWMSREEGEWGEGVQEFSRGYRTWSVWSLL